MSVYDDNPTPAIVACWRNCVYEYAAELIVGLVGRMISHSKHHYRDTHPDHVLAFNSNICVRSTGKIWYGDLDLTVHQARLQALADILREPVYVLHERDARFDREDDPDYTRPAAVYEPQGD